jgi:hypothetical protein
MLLNWVLHDLQLKIWRLNSPVPLLSLGLVLALQGINSLIYLRLTRICAIASAGCGCHGIRPLLQTSQTKGLRLYFFQPLSGTVHSDSAVFTADAAACCWAPVDSKVSDAVSIMIRHWLIMQPWWNSAILSVILSSTAWKWTHWYDKKRPGTARQKRSLPTSTRRRGPWRWRKGEGVVFIVNKLNIA